MGLVVIQIQDANGELFDVVLDKVPIEDHIPVYKLSVGAEGVGDSIVSSANPLPVAQQDPDDRNRRGEFDNLFKIPVGISVGHHEVHEGDAYIANVVDLSLAADATLILAFKTMPGTKRPHMVFDFTTLVGGHLDVIEGPTWNNQTGSLVAITNRRREAIMGSSGLLEDGGQAAFVATDNLMLNPTGLAGGTIIHSAYAFGAKNLGISGGRDITETILKPDTQYAYRFMSSGNSNEAQITLNWYEHTDE